MLGNPAGGVRCRTVDLAGILAAEGTATMTTHATIGVDDDLASRETRVAMRAADNELAGGVDIHVVVIIGESRRDDGPDDLFDEVGADHGIAIDAVLVLGADEHVRQANRDAVLVVEGDLGFAIGAQVRNGPRLANLAEPLGQAMRQPDRQWHQVGGLVAGIAEHHALVAGALPADGVLARLTAAKLFALVHALCDVCALLVDAHDHATGVSVEPEERVVVADLLDHLTGDLGDVDIGAGGDLASHHAQAGSEQRLARHAPVGILGQDGIEHGIADLISHLVRVTFGHALAGKCPLTHCRAPWLFWFDEWRVWTLMTTLHESRRRCRRLHGLPSACRSG
ncbi:unannotated protein [freshwater metagenome]|uniref:Unannotated protein n=1 Tax=freshwater metagenome TaxID=449393 RepID=A0A6J7F1A5_9ZZZZ